MDQDGGAFEAQRGRLVALAYRMLGDVARAEDMVQEAWIRWQGRGEEARSPEAYLVTLVTRLCLNELSSARTRREEARGDRLPEPVDLEDRAIGRLESLDQISMAFLVLLQRLPPPERAVLLLHDVFDFSHAEIAALVDRSEPACRKLLERARRRVATEKELFSSPSREEHQRLLGAFMQAAYAGEAGALVGLLAEDAVMVTDGGPEGRSTGGLRNLRAPLQGAPGIAAFVIEATRRGAPTLTVERHELNGQPAVVLSRDGTAFAAILLAVADGRIHRVFFHADPARLRHLGRGRGQGD